MYVRPMCNSMVHKIFIYVFPERIIYLPLPFFQKKQTIFKDWKCVRVRLGNLPNLIALTSNFWHDLFHLIVAGCPTYRNGMPKCGFSIKHVTWCKCSMPFFIVCNGYKFQTNSNFDQGLQTKIIEFSDL